MRPNPPIPETDMDKKVIARRGDEVLMLELVFIDGRPHARWESGGLTPLDPMHLQDDPEHMPPGIDAVYGQEVEDPTRLQ